MNLAAPPVWRERTIVAHDARLAVFEAGSTKEDAACVLLLHGLGHWSDAAWGRVLPLLDPAARYVALDLPGFGGSDKPRAAYDLPYFRSVLDEAIAQLMPERFALIGHSLGGFLAADYAGREPGRVERLALIAPAGFNRAPRHVAYALAGGFARWAFTRPPSRRLVQRALERSVVDPAALDEAIVERAHALAQQRPVREAFASIYAGALRVFADAARIQAGFARYQGSVLCIWGERDRYLSVRALREVKRVYPAARTLVLAQTGHLPMIERPGDTGGALKTYLRGFVRGRSHAAVVLAIAAQPPHGVLFLERAAHLREHGGQIGLPGGRVDEEDGGDFRRTALREMHEEVAIEPQRARIVGELPVVLQRVGRFDVTPFVAVLAPGTVAIPHPGEVASVFWVPLADVLAPGAIRDDHFTVNDVRVPTPIFEHDGRIVWGLTARVLQHFRAAWSDPGNPLRADIEAQFLSP